MNNIWRISQYLRHFFTARHSNGFGVHSPYMFDFIQSVLKERKAFHAFEAIEQIRMEMLNSKETIDCTDFGTGTGGVKKINKIAQKAIKSPRLAQMLFRIINHSKSIRILELGTSLGISSMYMAAVSSTSQCITIEGCPNISELAQQNFNRLGLGQIKLITANIDEELANILEIYGKQDFIFIDANHRYEALIRYFEICIAHANEQAIIVIDDIYWSPDMKKAWQKIQKHELVRSTIDIFHMGIVFLNPMLCKKQYKIRIKK